MFKKAGIFLCLREIALSTVLLSLAIQFSKVEADEDDYSLVPTPLNESQVAYAVGISQLSATGYPCNSECRKDGTEYYCDTVERRKSSRYYCSPLPGLDYRGKKCSTKCDHNGEKYTWCYLAEGSWGYCTKTKDEWLTDTSEIIASYGNACANQCGREKNTKYYWCRTKTPYKRKDWDFCSPQAGHDYKGRKCSGSCDHHGENYKWCNLVGGGWGYCSH